MTQRDQGLYAVGEELIRLGNVLKTMAAGPQTGEGVPEASTPKGRRTARVPRRHTLGPVSEQTIQNLQLLGRSGAEQRLGKMSARELLALGSAVGVRLDSKANKQELVKRLLWVLFDAEQGGELLRTLYQRGGEKEERAVFDADRQWFAQHRAELLKQYRGRYVAILMGQVVDSDPDFSQLAQRVYAKYGYRDLFMPRVGEETGPVRILMPRIIG